MAAAGVTMGRASELAVWDLFRVNLGWKWGLFLQPSVHHSHDLKTIKSSQSTNSISLAKGREKTKPKVTGVLPLGGWSPIFTPWTELGKQRNSAKSQKKKVPKEKSDGRIGKSLVPWNKIGRLVVKVTQTDGYPAFRATFNLLEVKNTVYAALEEKKKCKNNKMVLPPDDRMSGKQNVKISIHCLTGRPEDDKFTTLSGHD